MAATAVGRHPHDPWKHTGCGYASWMRAAAGVMEVAIGPLAFIP